MTSEVNQKRRRGIIIIKVKFEATSSHHTAQCTVYWTIVTMVKLPDDERVVVVALGKLRDFNFCTLLLAPQSNCLKINFVNKLVFSNSLRGLGLRADSENPLNNI